MLKKYLPHVEWAHGHPEGGGRLVDLVRQRALLQHCARLPAVQSHHAVANEAGAVADQDGPLADRLADLSERAVRELLESCGSAVREPSESRQRAGRGPPESRQRAVREPSESRQRAVREPPESRQRAVGQLAARLADLHAGGNRGLFREPLKCRQRAVGEPTCMQVATVASLVLAPRTFSSSFMTLAGLQGEPLGSR
jgi:hypothetical protein